MAYKFIFFGLIILSVILEIFSDILFKRWSVESRTIFLSVGLMIYFVGTIIWAFSLKYGHLSKAISIFTILNLIVIVLVGVMYFKEDLSILNKLGIGLGILSVVLMEL